jgi:hypothetical protein
MSIPAYDAREHIVRALEADLVGPFDASAREELLTLPPSRWYLTGFLAPEEGRENTTPTDKDELAAGSDVNDEERPGAGAETDPKRRQLFPASVGLSVMLPPGSKGDRIEVHIRYADYVRDAAEDHGPAHEDQATEPTSDGKRRRGYVWRRVPRDVKVVSLRLDPELLADGVEVPSSDGLWLVGTLGTVDVPGVVDAGARALTVFLVNRRPPRTGPTQDEEAIAKVGQARVSHLSAHGR